VSHTIELPPLLESRIEAEAEREGISPTEVILRLVRREFSPTVNVEEQKRLNAPSMTLLESWLADVPTTVQERVEAEADLTDFKRSINDTRAELGQRPAYPEAR
jgi:hypothetical protein